MAISKPYLGWRLQKNTRRKGTRYVLIRRSKGQSTSLTLGYISEPAAERCLRAMTWVAEQWHLRATVHARIDAAVIHSMECGTLEPGPEAGTVVAGEIPGEDAPEVQALLEKPRGLQVREPYRMGQGDWRIEAVNPLWLVAHAREGQEELDAVRRFLLALGEWLDERGWVLGDDDPKPPPIPDTIMGGLPVPNVYTTMPMRDYLERVWSVERYGPRQAGETDKAWGVRWRKTREGRLWKNWLLTSDLAGVPMGALDKILFNRFIKGLRLKNGNKPSYDTARLVRAAYKAMLTHAEEEGHIEKAHGFFRLRGFPKRVRGEPVPLSLEEENKLIEHAGTTMHAAMLAYALDTGTRPDEVVTLHWEDITWEKSDRADWGKVFIRGTKTRKSAATLPLGRRSRTRLEDWHQEQGQPADGPVFVWHGRPIKSFRRALSRAGERAGLEKVLNRYLLRHTTATRLAKRGLPMSDVARFMRHTNPRMVEQHYDHSDVSERLGAKAIHGEDGGGV